MPKIVIREQDNTLNRSQLEDNFTVVVPGFWNAAVTSTSGTISGTRENPFDEYNICELDSVAEFREKIGYVPAFEIHATAGDDSVDISKHYGNQIAYELLKLGYKVLYVNLGGVIATIDEATGEVSAQVTDYTQWKKFTNSDPTYGCESMLKVLKDKSSYNFRFLLTGSLSQDVLLVANEAIRNIAHVDAENKSAEYFNQDNGRGDCIALMDIPEEATATPSGISFITPEYKINSIRDAALHIPNSKYAAWFCPAVDLKGLSNISQYADNTTLPASFYYLACLAKSREKNFAEWYAVAGLTRGVSEYTITSPTAILGETAVNALQPRKPVDYNSQEAGTKATFDTAVNIVAKLHGSYYLWGNRTSETLTEEDLIASHFLNIRELCCTLKKDIYEVCKKCTFDPNSDILWINFCNALRPTLEKMKADQGINDYDFVKLESKRAELKALVRIVPIEAVEDFDITVSLEDSLESMTITEE